MGNEIDAKRFSGHLGFVVKDTNNNGLLDDSDEVRKLVVDEGVKGRVDTKNDKLSDTPVAANDPELLAAVSDFVDKSKAANGLLREVSELNKDLETARAGKGPKPPEARVSSLADNARRLRESNAAPSLRAEAELVLSSALGLTADSYRDSQLAKMGPGKEAYRTLKDAVATDPENRNAWIFCAHAWLGLNAAMESKPGLVKWLAKLAGVNPEADARMLASGMQKFSGDPVLQVYLLEVLRAQQRAGVTVDAKLLTNIESGVSELAISYPKDVEVTQRAIDKVRSDVLARVSG